ncbi:MCE family protein [Nocardia barduliensis]|uniref:MCE family protein n=1 Tax=Nocardia barduliensis TaxID=2736643 RepID=UPI001573F5A8|nr:MCE family protein [Nocardia barduliensis]
MTSSTYVGRLVRVIRRPLEAHDPRVLGVTALTVLIAVLAAAVGFNSLGIGQRTYQAEFAQAAGLRVGDGVTVAGVPVGSVTDQELAGDRVVVTMRIADDVALGGETTAAIKLTTLLGARYVEVRPAGAGKLSDRRIPLSHTAVPYDLQQALENATTTFEQVDAAQIGRSLDALATQLDGVPAVLPGMLANVRALASILGSRRDELGALLAGVRQLTSMVTAQEADVSAILTVGRDLLNDIAARRQVIEMLMSATTRLVDQVRGIVVDDRPKLDDLLRGLNGLLGSLARHDDLLRNTLEILPVTVRNLTNASGNGNSVDFNSPAGVLVDSWMCALSGRAEQADLPKYFGDCR